MGFDILLKGGRVIDGSGRDAVRADVAITGDLVMEIGDISEDSAKEVLDVTGKIVCPGFIDVHNHFDVVISSRSEHSHIVEQGITTAFLSSDGFGWAPLPPDRLEEMKMYLSVFYGAVPDHWGGERVEQYLNLFEGNSSVNVVPFAPHGPIRLAAMGWAERTASPSEIQNMKNAVEEWMKAGAFGINTGLQYEPTANADTDELIELSKTAAKYKGIYVAHQRGYWDEIETGLSETLEISTKANIPVHVSHLKVDEKTERLLNEAIDKGIDISFDMYPYTAGFTHLVCGLPNWAQAGPPDRVLQLLYSGNRRDELIRSIENTFADAENVQLSGVLHTEFKQFEGRSLLEAAQNTQKPIGDLVIEILIQSRLSALGIYHWTEEFHAELYRTFRHSHIMVGSDGIFTEGIPHPRAYGTFPTVIEKMVKQEKILTLEKAVRIMTGYAAERFQIHKRGFVREGYFADLVVFDEQEIGTSADYANPRTLPTGIEHVLVNGDFALKNRRITGKLAGKVLRKQQ